VRPRHSCAKPTSFLLKPGIISSCVTCVRCLLPLASLLLPVHLCMCMCVRMCVRVCVCAYVHSSCHVWPAQGLGVLIVHNFNAICVSPISLLGQYSLRNKGCLCTWHAHMCSSNMRVWLKSAALLFGSSKL